MADPLLPSSWGQVWASTDAVGFMSWMREQGVTAPHLELLGYRVDHYEPGVSELIWRVPPPLLNPAGIAHGGFLAAILDDAAGMAAASAYPRWVPQLTVHLSVDYLAPVRPDRDHRVSGRVIRHGKGSSLSDATITDPDGTLLARGSGVFQPNRRMVPRDLWAEAGL